MQNANLNNEPFEVNDGLDSIVIIKDLGDIPGGRTLDVSSLPEGVNVILSGHVLVQNDTTKDIAPLGVTSGAYDNLPQGYSYVGVLKCSVLRKDPRASILTIGQVNAGASPYPVTSTIKEGLPMIQFLF